MHGYDVNEALYLHCEFYVHWLRGSGFRAVCLHSENVLI